MHEDLSGAAVEAVNPLDDSIRTLERLRDLIMVRLHERRLPQKAIAHVLGMSQQNVSRRLREIPPHVRKAIARQSLGGLD